MFVHGKIQSPKLSTLISLNVITSFNVIKSYLFNSKYNF